MDLARTAAERIRQIAGPRTGNPVIDADHATSMADARIALCLAKGIAPEDIDPASGYDLSRDAYERSRASWQYHAEHFGLTDWTRAGIAQAYATWVERRPQYANGDDWFAGIRADALIEDWPCRPGPRATPPGPCARAGGPRSRA